MGALYSVDEIHSLLYKLLMCDDNNKHKVMVFLSQLTGYKLCLITSHCDVLVSDNAQISVDLLFC